MKAQELYEIVFKKAQEFGMRPKNEFRTIINAKGNTIVRNNLSSSSYADGTAFFGFLNSAEETSGIYSDFSFVVFPEENLGSAVVSLGVGSAGFKDDGVKATSPGLRRSFIQLRSTTEKVFFKTAFDDISTTSYDLLKEIRENYPSLESVIETYKTYLPASCIVSLDEEHRDKSLEVVFQWLAMYAKMRNWGTKDQQKKISQILENVPTLSSPDVNSDISKLLEERKYVVLQGAPGTGKTYTALEIAKGYDAVYFVQFHAETSYSDFVYGLEPNIEENASEIRFRSKFGTLYKAIKKALEPSSPKVLLIIDEINRANLSNVLGPVFYLFEYQSGGRSVEFEIGKGLTLTKMPDNLHVLATMNTADRSLAVVDFALRRRFAWYTLRPRKFDIKDKSLCFMEKQFNALSSIFYDFATDEELSLEPGPSYFIVPRKNNTEMMKERLEYELMPLIKEYLAEGYLLKAKDSFVSFFQRETGLLMYE